MKLKAPNPRDFDCPDDYYDASEAYQAYINGKYHVCQPQRIKHHLSINNPDSPHFIEPRERHNDRAEV